MELSVKKASMSLLLKEQYSQLEQKILHHIENDSTLKNHLSQMPGIKNKLDLLQEEIESDPNVETLQQIIHSADNRKSSFEQKFEDESSLGKFILVLQLFIKVTFDRITRLVSHG